MESLSTSSSNNNTRSPYPVIIPNSKTLKDTSLNTPPSTSLSTPPSTPPSQIRKGLPTVDSSGRPITWAPIRTKFVSNNTRSPYPVVLPSPETLKDSPSSSPSSTPPSTPPSTPSSTPPSTPPSQIRKGLPTVDSNGRPITWAPLRSKSASTYSLHENSRRHRSLNLVRRRLFVSNNETSPTIQFVDSVFIRKKYLSLSLSKRSVKTMSDIIKYL